MSAGDKPGLNSPEAREALAEAAEDARLDDALSLADVNPIEPRVGPGLAMDKSIRADRARKARLRLFNRATRTGEPHE